MPSNVALCRNLTLGSHEHHQHHNHHKLTSQKYILNSSEIKAGEEPWHQIIIAFSQPCLSST